MPGAAEPARSLELSQLGRAPDGGAAHSGAGSRVTRTRPGQRVTPAEVSDLPDCEDGFDRPGLDPLRGLTDARQRGREPLVTEALPVRFAVPQGHNAPAAGYRPPSTNSA
jgi:hypothetical protein